MPVAYLCDFDGTVAPEDIGAAFLTRFAPMAEARRRELLERWKRDEIGSRALKLAECETLSCSGAEALAFSRRFRLDPEFAPFVREARGRGDAVMVVSDGFDFYVRDQLARAGLPDLPWASNHLHFDAAGPRLEFPYDEGGCGACGNCKAPHVRRYQALGYRSVLVGDGLSDRCGARAADGVLARGSLLEWCRSEGRPVTPFGSFGEVIDYARRMAAGVPARRA